MRLTEVVCKMGSLFIDEGYRGCTIRIGDQYLVLINAGEVKKLEEALAKTRARLETWR